MKRRMCETCEYWPETGQNPCKMGIYTKKYEDGYGDVYHSIQGCKHFKLDMTSFDFEAKEER